MLVLTRKLGQTVDVDGPYSVTVLGYRDGNVKLGFEADKSVTIVRDELRKETKAERIRRRILG